MRFGRAVGLAGLVATLVVCVAASDHSRSSASAASRRVAQEAPGAPWSHSFSLVGGGGLRKPADGAIAGEADLGRVWVGVRGGDGRVVLASSRGLWAVGHDGRLSAIRGVPHDRGRPLQLVTLGDGTVAISSGTDSVYGLAAGSLEAKLLARLASGSRGSRGPLGVGLGADGGLVVIAGGRVFKREGKLLVATGRSLWHDDGIREPRGAGPVRDGLLVGSLFPNGGVNGDPEQDEGNVLLARAGAAPRVLYAPPAQQAVRNVAVLSDRRALIAGNDSTLGDLDGRPLPLQAGPHLDRQLFAYGVGEEYFGWIWRRQVHVRTAGGVLLRARWAGPPADWIAPDGAAGDVLVASGGRLWSTKAGLSAPDVRAIWEGRVALRLGRPATVAVSVSTSSGRLLTRRSGIHLRAGLSEVRLPELPRSGLLRVAIVADEGETRSSSEAWAFAGPRRLSVGEGKRVLDAVARRLNVGFEGAVAHGVDRCAVKTPTAVRCRWTTGGSSVRPTNERTVSVALGSSGYLVESGTAKPSPKAGRNRHLLGAPYDASA